MTTIESTRQRYAALNQARRREATPILDNETMSDSFTIVRLCAWDISQLCQKMTMEFRMVLAA